jgi:hypothetical protein
LRETEFDGTPRFQNQQLAIANPQSGTSLCNILIITSTIYKDDAQGFSKLRIGDG